MGDIETAAEGDETANMVNKLAGNEELSRSVLGWGVLLDWNDAKMLSTLCSNELCHPYRDYFLIYCYRRSYCLYKELGPPGD